jgi:hypothetical protein
VDIASLRGNGAFFRSTVYRSTSKCEPMACVMSRIRSNTEDELMSQEDVRRSLSGKNLVVHKRRLEVNRPACQIAIFSCYNRAVDVQDISYRAVCASGAAVAIAPAKTSSTLIDSRTRRVNPPLQPELTSPQSKLVASTTVARAIKEDRQSTWSSLSGATPKASPGSANISKATNRTTNVRVLPCRMRSVASGRSPYTRC